MTNRSTPDRSVFFGNIETYSAIKDYQRNGRCVRIIAIDEENYKKEILASEDGVTVSTLEISYWEFCRCELGKNRWLTNLARQEIDFREGTLSDREKWYRIEVAWETENRHGYAYKTFEDSEPRYFELISCTPADDRIELLPLPEHKSREISLLPDPTENILSSGNSSWMLFSFHVGQGMCSLVSNGESGVLLDLGAGIPVTRSRYIHEKAFRNDLAQAVEPLSTLYLVLSHADQDHWRILAWDKAIRDKIIKIFVPKGAKSLAFKDPSVIKKTVESTDLKINLSTNSCHIKVYRSKPSQIDDNGECLVSVFETSSKRALIAGDYVYHRFSTDHNPDIKNLHNLEFDAVIVPHHGDHASSVNIVRSSNNAVAFFSAGTHRGYGHPTKSARIGHIMARYGEICDNTYPYIKKVPLISD